MEEFIYVLNQLSSNSWNEEDVNENEATLTMLVNPFNKNIKNVLKDISEDNYFKIYDTIDKIAKNNLKNQLKNKMVREGASKVYLDETKIDYDQLVQNFFEFSSLDDYKKYLGSQEELVSLQLKFDLTNGCLGAFLKVNYKDFEASKYSSEYVSIVGNGKHELVLKAVLNQISHYLTK